MIRNFFQQSHWSNPRQTIANQFADDDYGYVYHAGVLFSEFLRASDISASEARNMRLLDYGCGTGRVARFFSLIFGEVCGYDPVQECIDESKIEGERIKMFRRQPALFTSDLDELGAPFDVIVSINVLEHLDQERLSVALDNINRLMKENACCYLWIHKIKNAEFFDQHKLPQPESNISIIKGQKLSGQLAYSQSKIPSKSANGATK